MEASPPTISRGLIDTPILLAYRTGEPNSLDFLTAIRLLGDPEFSELSAIALICNCLNPAELVSLDWFFYAAISYSVTARISQRAYRIVHRLTPPCGLTADDAIVAATAIEHKLPLYALNPNRFATVPGLTVLLPY
ncbi:MAG: hypothetical protein K8U57_21025 [Planctomycetes bacterium]|nr:hypothetical protein [Planctomycetota bacterium]